MGFEGACYLACNRLCWFLHVDRLPKFNDKLSIHSSPRLYVGLGVSFVRSQRSSLTCAKIVQVQPDRSEGKDVGRRHGETVSLRCALSPVDRPTDLSETCDHRIGSVKRRPQDEDIGALLPQGGRAKNGAMIPDAGYGTGDAAWV